MATAEKTIGNWNSKLRIIAVRVGQSGANGSTVDVTVDMYNGGTAPAVNGTGANWSLSGDVSKGNASFTFSIAPKTWGRVGTHRAVVQHDSNGNKTAKITVNVGYTSTTTFGTPGSLTVSLALPRIPKPSNAPSTPTVSNITSSGMRIAWNAPTNTNGASITRYQVQRADNSGMTTGVATAYTGTTRNYTNSNLAANRTYYWRVRAENSAGWSNWSGVRSGTTAVNKPAGVSFGVLSRVSDTAQNLTWTRNATTAAPYTQIQIDRKDTVNGSWVRVANLAGTATSYRDNTTVAGRRYDYRVRASNAGGQSGWTNTYGVNTTPPADRNVRGAKSGQSITVSWDKGATQWGVVQRLIEDNPGGTGWVQVAAVGDVASWTHSNPNPSVTHQYRVKTVVYLYTANDAGRLTSAASAASPVVQLLAPPLAPTLLGPSGTLDKDEPIVFRWQHNAVDTTEQEAFELRYRVDGGTWVNLAGTTAETVTVDALGLSGSIEWQVRTRGEFPTFGPYSSVAAFTLAAPPSVAINAPVAGLYDASRVDVVWGYYQEEEDPQARWVVTLLDSDGDTVETRQGSNQAETVALQSTLRDAAEYTITVEVTASNGLKATDTVTFTTDFPLPVTVEPYVTFDRQTGSASIAFGDAPEPAAYRWTGPVNGSPSTRTTAAGTLTNLATNPSFEGTSGTVEVRRNLVNKPREMGILIDGDAARTSREVLPEGGVRYTRLLGEGQAGFDSVDLPVEEGAAYALSVEISDLTSLDTYQVMNGYNRIPGQVWGVVGNRITILFTSNLTGNARLRVRLTDPIGSSWVADKVLLEERTSVGPYFDGSFSPDPDLTPSWVGDANNSASVLTGNKIANVVAFTPSQQIQYSSSDRPSVGTKLSRSVLQTGGAIGIQTTQGAVPQGVLYTLLMRARASREGIKVYPRVQSAFIRAITLTTEWQEIRLTVTSGQGGAAQTGLLLMNGEGHLPGDFIDIDQVMIVEGEYNGPYWDGSTQSTSAAEVLDLQRRIGEEGEWVTLAAGLALDDAVTDPLPDLVQPNYYRAISRTSLPTEAIGEPVELTINEPQWLYFNHGPGFGLVDRLMGNPEVSQEMGRNSAVHPMAGVSFPTSVRGSLLTASYAVSGVITPDSSQRTDWEDLAFTDDIICYRDPAGRRVFGNIGLPTFAGTTLQTVELDFERTHFIEGLIDDSVVEQEA